MAELNDEQVTKEQKGFIDGERYITPGAKHYFRRVWVGYLVLAIAGTIGVATVTQRSDNNIRRDINAYASVSCVNSKPLLEKFNRFFDNIIEAANDTISIQRQAREQNLKTKDFTRAALNEQTIAVQENLKASAMETKLHIPTKKECEKKILK